MDDRHRDEGNKRVKAKIPEDKTRLGIVWLSELKKKVHKLTMEKKTLKRKLGRAP